MGDVSANIEFTLDDVAEVIAYGETPDGWDGEVSGVVRLKDGRYVAWETFWGPTGDGFSEDAYGGDADITIAGTLDAAIRFGMTDAGRRLCGLKQPTSATPTTEDEA